MSAVNEVLGQLPSGYLSAPMFPGQEQSPLRLCVVVRKTPDPVAGHWVVIRDGMDARVLLGAIIDTDGTLHRYVEIWLQNLEGIKSGVWAQRDILNNKVLDERWRLQFDSLRQADPATIFTTGWESKHPAPTVIDLSRMVSVALSDKEGGEYRLCEDDALLSAAGLPVYSTSLDRYLYQPALGQNAKFIPITADTPTNDRTRPQPPNFPPTVIPFNLGGGLVLVRDYNPLSYDDLLILLETGSWQGIQSGQSVLQPIAALATAEVESVGLGNEGLLLSRAGKPGRLIETFYLRICALTAAVAAVRDVVRQTQRPILNLSADHFRATLDRPRPGLPTLWSMNVSITDAGDAVGLSFAGTDTSYFLSGSPASVFRPSAGDASHGQGNYRIRQVLTESRGVVVEGTFTPHDRLAATRNDLLRLRLTIAAGRADLYTRLQPEMALAGGEWRLRSVPQSFPPAVVAQLKAAEGVPFNGVAYEHIPLLSAPCDLYALAVLGVQTLLLKPGAALPVALDEAYSLARQVAQEYDSAQPIGKRIAAIFAKDSRWGESLGPGHLGGDYLDGAAVAALLPATLWFDTLAVIVRMFPGVGPDSASVDYGDAPPNAVHRVFEPALADLDALMNRAKSLICADWRFNREVQWVIRQLISAAGPDAKPSAPARPGVVRA